jgi:hypothetical protein
MSPEQDPQDTLDKSINPEVLVIQQGEDAGRIADVERGRGRTRFEGGAETNNKEMIEGLPVVGAEEEARVRELSRDEQFQEIKPGFVAEQWSEMSKKDKEPYFDKAGEEAMAAEVSRRAMELVPNASKELQEAIGKQAAENFKAELETKKNEKQAAADAEAQALLDRLKGGTPISEVLPDLRPSILGTEYDAFLPTS